MLGKCQISVVIYRFRQLSERPPALTVAVSKRTGAAATAAVPVHVSRPRAALASRYSSSRSVGRSLLLPVAFRVCRGFCHHVLLEAAYQLVHLVDESLVGGVRLQHLERVHVQPERGILLVSVGVGCLHCACDARDLILSRSMSSSRTSSFAVFIFSMNALSPSVATCSFSLPSRLPRKAARTPEQP